MGYRLEDRNALEHEHQQYNVILASIDTWFDSWNNDHYTFAIFPNQKEHELIGRFYYVLLVDYLIVLQRQVSSFTPRIDKSPTVLLRGSAATVATILL